MHYCGKTSVLISEKVCFNLHIKRSYMLSYSMLDIHVWTVNRHSTLWLSTCYLWPFTDNPKQVTPFNAKGAWQEGRKRFCLVSTLQSLPPKKLQQSVWMKLLWETSGEQPHYACNKALLTAHRLSTVFGLNYKTNSRTDSQISKFCLRICWLNYFDSCCFFFISFLIYSDIVPSKPIYRLL